MINFATIGTGWITEKFIDASKSVEQLNLIAVYSRDIVKAQDFAKANGAKYCFDDLEQMAQSNQIDAVYIASPNSLHFDQALLFINNKKHVICEKPITLNQLQAKLLYDRASENNVIFMEAMMSSYVPQLKLLKEAVNSIGNISLAKIDFSQLSSKYPLYRSGKNPNIFNMEFATGCVMDLGVYCVYLALNLFGLPLSSTSSAVKMPNGIDACGSTILKYRHMLAILTYSKVGQSDTSSEIIGDKGTVTINSISSLKEIAVNYNDGSRQVIHNSLDENAMKYEAQAFVNYITDKNANVIEYEYNKTLSINSSQLLKKIRDDIDLVFPMERN